MTCLPPPVEYADARAVAELAEPLRSRIAQAIKDAPTGGLILVSGKRTDWQQWLLRQAHGCRGRECDRTCKGRPTTAVPGRSNHRNLSASVAAADMGGRDLDWLIANRRRYGLELTVPGEKWHFEAVGNPTVPIAPYARPTTAPPKWLPIYPGETDRTIHANGGLDNEVSEVQIRLSKLAKSWKNVPSPGKIDGAYGPTSVASLRAFKRAIIALQRADGQTPWPNDDGNIGPKTIDMLRWWTA